MNPKMHDPKYQQKFLKTKGTLLVKEIIDDITVEDLRDNDTLLNMNNSTVLVKVLSNCIESKGFKNITEEEASIFFKDFIEPLAFDEVKIDTKDFCYIVFSNTAKLVWKHWHESQDVY